MNVETHHEFVSIESREQEDGSIETVISIKTPDGVLIVLRGGMQLRDVIQQAHEACTRHFKVLESIAR